MLQILALFNTIIFAPLTVYQVLMGFTIHTIGRLCNSKKLKEHGQDLAIAADQNMNVIWLGYPDETISSRTGRAIASGKPKWYIKYVLRPFVDFMAKGFGQKNHCVGAIEEQLDMKDQYEVWKWFKE